MMKFKTNLKCGGCVQTVRPNLDSIKEIKEWSVDLNTPDRVLTIEADKLEESTVVNAFKAAGYQAERIG